MTDAEKAKKYDSIQLTSRITNEMWDVIITVWDKHAKDHPYEVAQAFYVFATLAFSQAQIYRNKKDSLKDSAALTPLKVQA